MIPRAVPYPAVARDLLYEMVRQANCSNDIWIYAILVDPRLYWAS